MPSTKPQTSTAAKPSLKQRAGALKAEAARVTRRPTQLPEPGSEAAREAFYAACHEHSLLTHEMNETYLELRNPAGGMWTKDALSQALDDGGITLAEFTRLHPIASERELRFRIVEHRENLHVLYALAHPDEYPRQPEGGRDDETRANPDLVALIADHRRLLAEINDESRSDAEADVLHDATWGCFRKACAFPIAGPADFRAKFEAALPEMREAMINGTDTGRHALNCIAADVLGQANAVATSAKSLDFTPWDIDGPCPIPTRDEWKAMADTALPWLRLGFALMCKTDADIVQFLCDLPSEHVEELMASLGREERNLRQIADMAGAILGRSLAVLESHAAHRSDGDPSC